MTKKSRLRRKYNKAIKRFTHNQSWYTLEEFRQRSKFLAEAYAFHSELYFDWIDNIKNKL